MTLHTENDIEWRDAEIARLNEIIESLSDHHVAAERMEFIRQQGAEIERLKAEVAQLQPWVDKCAGLASRNADLQRLLTRAADKFEKVTWGLDFVSEKVWEAYEVPEVIAELRKAAE